MGEPVLAIDRHQRSPACANGCAPSPLSKQPGPPGCQSNPARIGRRHTPQPLSDVHVAPDHSARAIAVAACLAPFNCADALRLQHHTDKVNTGIAFPSHASMPGSALRRHSRHPRRMGSVGFGARATAACGWAAGAGVARAEACRVRRYESEGVVSAGRAMSDPPVRSAPCTCPRPPPAPRRHSPQEEHQREPQPEEVMSDRRGDHDQCDHDRGQRCHARA